MLATCRMDQDRAIQWICAGARIMLVMMQRERRVFYTRVFSQDLTERI